MKTLQMDWKTNLLESHNSTYLQKFIKKATRLEFNKFNKMVSSINCHTANISKYIECHWQPILKQISSYIRDTNDFINKISAVKSVTEDIFLIIIDVRSLYAIIPV